MALVAGGMGEKRDVCCLNNYFVSVYFCVLGRIQASCRGNEGGEGCALSEYSFALEWTVD